MFTNLFRIGRDAVIRQAGDQSVCDLALAYNYGRKGQDGVQPSQWIKASLWGKRAESLAQYLTKGSQVVATLDDLHIQTREHEGKTYTDLVARVVDVKLLPKPAAAAKPAPAPAPKPAPRPAEPVGDQFADDEIPF